MSIKIQFQQRQKESRWFLPLSYSLLLQPSTLFFDQLGSCADPSARGQRTQRPWSWSGWRWRSWWRSWTGRGPCDVTLGVTGPRHWLKLETSWLHRSEAELRKGGTWDHHRPHHQPHPHRPHCHPQHFPHCHHHWQLWPPHYADSVAVASSRMQYIVEIKFALN